MRTGRSQAVAIDNAHRNSFADTVFIGVGTTLQKITAAESIGNSDARNRLGSSPIVMPRRVAKFGE